MKLINTAIIASTLVVATVTAHAGDAAAGKSAFNAKGCVGCHGAGGAAPVTSNPPTPALVGKDAAFIKKQLADFKSGARVSATMNAMSAMVNETEIENIAAYLSSQK